jgi:sugar lactone lactonase YvrE
MTRRAQSLSIFLLLMSVPFQVAFAGSTASFRYRLSNFEGPVRSQWARLAVDLERNEVYALHRRKNDIRVFDEHGMEVFVFGDDMASAADITIGDGGDIFILSAQYQASTVHLFDYRGEQVSELSLANLPAKFSKFIADRLVYRDHSLYLVDSDALMVVVVDEEGRFQEGYDLSDTMKRFVPRANREKAISNNDWKAKKVDNIDINGFTVDNQGNMFFTIPSLLSAYRLSADGEIIPFGRSGSGRGKFSVTAGIATDEMGYVYVSDRLRCVVLVFNQDLQFQMEFGYRGDGPSNLIVPDDLAIDSSGNVYIGQAANRGVSVFKVVHQNVSKIDHRNAGESQSNDSVSTGSEKPERALEKNASNQEKDEDNDKN